MNWRALVEAQWDIIDVSDHYDHLSAGLGNDFVIEARAAIHRVAAQPRLYGMVDPRVRGREVRQTLVHRFPYRVIYEVTRTDVVIVAFVHTRSSDRRWRRRLRRN